MRLKTLIVTVVILAVASAAVFLARRPGPPPSKDARIGQPLASSDVVNKAAKLRISDQGKTVTLSRQSDGTWRDASYYDLPADFSKLSSFISNLTDATLERLVTSNPTRIARLDFKDTKLELLDSADKPLWSVTLGKNAETGRGRFVRFGDEQKAYLVALNAWIDTDAKSWANAELLALKPDDMAKIELGFPATADTGTEGKPADGATTVTLSRAKKDDAWTADKTPSNQRVKTDKLQSVLSSVGTIRFTDTSDLNDPNVAAAKAHQRVVKLTTFDGKTYTVAMGRKPEEKKLKAPTPSTDGKTGPASLGSVADLGKKDEKKDGENKADANKPVAPEFETIPAGPVYVFITSSDANAPVNALMQKRAFQIGEYVFTGLPQKPDELFEPAPAAPAPKPEPTAAKDTDKKSAPEPQKAAPEPKK